MAARRSTERLLIVTDDPAIEFDGQVHSTGSVNLFWLELAKSFGECRISMPIKRTNGPESFFSTALDPPGNTKISPRKYYFSKTDALKDPTVIVRNAASLYRDILWADSILLRIPSVNLPAVFPLLYALRKRKTIVLYVAGDFFGRNYKGEVHPGVRTALKNRVVALYDALERKAARSFRTLANGKRLVEKYSAEPFDLNLVRAEKVLKKPGGFDPGSVKILYAGRLDSNKGVDVLLRAIGLMDWEMKKRVRTIIVGDGVERENLEGQAEALGIAHMVEFAGQVPFGRALEGFFESSDIFVLPSRSEGAPKVLFEAFAFGLPVIATNVGGIPAMTGYGECACLVPPDSPEALKEAVERLIDDAALWERLAANGIAKALGNTMEMRVKELKNIMDGGGKKPLRHDLQADF